MTRASLCFGSTRSLLLAPLALLGCGGTSTSLERDAAPDVVDVVDAAVPSSREPALPTLTPCPTGFTERALDELVVCEPSPDEAASCEGATFRLPGSTTCEPVDDGCEAGPFPTLSDTTRTAIFVLAGALGGDGTEARPYGSLDEALAHTSTGPVTLALGAGDYTVSAALPDDVAILGVCADRTRLVALEGEPALQVPRTTTATLDGLTFTGDGIGLVVQGQAQAHGLVIEATMAAGLVVVDGSLDATRVLVRGTRTLPDGTLGRGVDVERSGALTITDSVIEANHFDGVGVANGTFEATRIAIRDTATNGAGTAGGGLHLVDDATASLRASSIERAVVSGVLADQGTSVTLEDVTIRDIVSEASQANGRGLFVRDAHATLTRVLVERASGAGVYATRDAVVEATDLVVHATLTSGGFGTGLGVVNGADVHLTRAALLDSRWMGLVAAGEGVVVDGTDVSIRRVEVASDVGEGMSVSAGGTATLERFVIEDAHNLGALVKDSDSLLTLRHGVIRRIAESEAFAVGRGAEADIGGHLVLEDVAIDDVVETGIVSFAQLEPADTLVELTGVTVTNVHERACATTTCATTAGGSGVAAVFGGRIIAADLHVDGAPLCGVQVAEASSLDVASGVISQSAIGACVQVEGYDLARVVAGVEFRDNERNVESASVYVPSGGPS